jgi:hypothetical protein
VRVAKVRSLMAGGLLDDDLRMRAATTGVPAGRGEQ